MGVNMENDDRILQQYLQKKLKSVNIEKSKECPGTKPLLDYLAGSLSGEISLELEKHLSHCPFCLRQISIASDALSQKKKDLIPVPEKTINKVNRRLEAYLKNTTRKRKGKKTKQRFYFLAMLVFFVLSFLLPKYFAQFLVGALILGMRWSLEGKGGQTLIMVLDSLRKQSQGKNDEISNRIKNHLEE